jgi:hypothetical protein
MMVTHITLPKRFGNRAGATADSSVGRGNRSRLYELSLWMWHYGWGPRKVTVTVAQAEQRLREGLTGSRKRRAVQTLKRRQEERGTGARGGARDMDAVGDE